MSIKTKENKEEIKEEVSEDMLNLKEENKEEIKEEVKETKTKINKNIDFKGRGFETLEDAIDFPNTEVFKKLGKADQEEYLNWLKK